MVEHQTFPDAGVFFLATEPGTCPTCQHATKERHYIGVRGHVVAWTQVRDGTWSATVEWGDCNYTRLAEADLWSTRAEVDAEIQRLNTPTVVWDGDVLVSVDGHAAGHALDPAPEIVVRRRM